MVAISLSGAVTREGADGPVGPKTWECTRSQGRKGSISIFIFFDILIEFRSFVPIYLPGWRRWKSRLLLAPVFISEALGIVKSDSRSK